VLLWSQLHGEEATHTIGLADLFAYWRREPEDPRVAMLRGALTVVAVPMLHPDGAERSDQMNGRGGDAARDASGWASPELRALRDLYHRVRPDFAFGLRDREVPQGVGESEGLAALALLACPADAETDDGPIRARRVCGAIRRAVEPLVGERIARFPEEHDATGMGGFAARSGAASVLVEAGFWPDDTEKQFRRTLSFAAVLGALQAIAEGRWPHAAGAVRVAPGGPARIARGSPPARRSAGRRGGTRDAGPLSGPASPRNRACRLRPSGAGPPCPTGRLPGGLPRSPSPRSPRR
jgi:hypothetical protein